MDKTVDGPMSPPLPDPPRGTFIHKGRRIEVHEVALPGPDGPVRRDLITHPGSAVILPLTEAGEVVLIENHRYPVGAPLLELPAGTLEPPEAPFVCAARELTEETGYTAGRLRPLGAFYPCPGFSTELMHIFLATELVAGEQALAEGEQITVKLMSVTEFEALIARGGVFDAKTLAAWALYRGQMGGDPS